MADKIDSLKIGSTSYDIDLPPDATPSIASLTTSGAVTANGGTTTNGLVVKNSTGQAATFTVTNAYDNVGSLSLSGVDYLNASNVQATFSTVSCGTAYITQLGDSDMFLHTYLDQNFTFKTNESGESGRGQATYGVKIPNTYGWTANRTLATTNDIPTVNNGTLTIQGNGTAASTFTANQSGNTTLNIKGSGGTTVTKSANNEITVSTGTIPTVNNGTLTIQKNGANVQTFTANQSGNATANITVPVNLSDINNRNQSYIQWGGPNLISSVSPLEVASIDDLGHNKFAFMPAAGVIIQYSRDGGSTWIDYGADDATKRSLVTISSTLHIGNRTGSSNTTNDRLRIILNSNAAGGSIYCDLKRLLIYLTTSGSGGCKVTVEYRSIGDYLSGTDTWSTAGTYDLGGWSGWNSIPFSGAFGGNSSQTSQTAQIRLTFSVTSVSASYENLTIYAIRGIAFPLWQSPSTMASTGHLYSYNINQNASFPAGVSATTFTENGTALSNKYLGKSAKAADADKLDGNDSTYYLNYNNLTNKPTIPTVNNATLTIQKNGSTINTFTANASSNVTANITVPTKTSDLNNDSGFLTSHQSIKTLKTDNTTAQSTSSSEAIAGSGTINLHKVAKTGTYSDLIGTPTIPTTYLKSASVSGNTLTLTPASGTATTFTPYNQTVAADGILFPANRNINFVGKDGITVAADGSIANQINISGSYPTPEIIDISDGITQAIKNKVAAKPLSFLQDSNGYLYYPSYSSGIPNYYESFDTESCESKALSIDWTNLTVEESHVYYAEVVDVQNKTYIHNLTITPTSTSQAHTLYLKIINRTSTALTKTALLTLSKGNALQPRTVECGILNSSSNFYPARLVSTSFSGAAPTFTILVNGQSSTWTLTLSSVTDDFVQL